MAEIVYVVSPTITLPNITVEEKYKDGVLISHRLTTNEGYVMYNTAENNTEPQIDPETGDYVIDQITGMPVEIPITYYYKQATIPIRVPVENWTWVAVVDKKEMRHF